MTTRTLGWTTVAAFVLMQPAVARAQTSVRPAASAQEPPALKDDQDKTSYAVGMNLGSAIRRDSAHLDVNLIVQGLKDAFSSGTTLVTDAEMRTLLARLQAEVKSKQATQLSEKAAKARSEGEAFLAENKSKEGVVTTASGLQYKVLKAGNGKMPTVTDAVVCHYRGTLIDGTEFDSSYKTGKPATLAVNRVIKGWREALQLMPAGSKWQLFIPSELAYGERGAGARIGSNTTLIFDVELISIQDASTAAVTSGSGTNAAARPGGGSAVTNLAGINVSFKLDPRITKGLYMGDRWVPPPYTQTGNEHGVTVEARAQELDGTGKAVGTRLRWIPADTEIATVTPGAGNQVTITVHRSGQTSLRVISDGVSKELEIKAEKRGAGLQVMIAQKTESSD